MINPSASDSAVLDRSNRNFGSKNHTEERKIIAHLKGFYGSDREIIIGELEKHIESFVDLEKAATGEVKKYFDEQMRLYKRARILYKGRAIF